MKPSEILIKPILTEKANAQQEKLHRYAFKVAKKSNKLEIKKAIETFYGVTVTSVNTVVAPAKIKPVIQRPVLSRDVKQGIKKLMLL